MSAHASHVRVLSLEISCERLTTELGNGAVPSLEPIHQPARLGCQPRAAMGASTPDGQEHRTAKRALHAAHAIQAGSIAPAYGLAGLPDGAGLVDRAEEAEIVRSHEEGTLGEQPDLVTRSEARGRARTGGHAASVSVSVRAGESLRPAIGAPDPGDSRHPSPLAGS